MSTMGSSTPEEALLAGRHDLESVVAPHATFAAQCRGALLQLNVLGDGSCILNQARARAVLSLPLSGRRPRSRPSRRRAAAWCAWCSLKNVNSPCFPAPPRQQVEEKPAYCADVLVGLFQRGGSSLPATVVRWQPPPPPQRRQSLQLRAPQLGI